MSDRYNWDDERGGFEPERPLDIPPPSAAGGPLGLPPEQSSVWIMQSYRDSPPELDEILARHASAAALEAERVAGYEDVPLSLTTTQRNRLWCILRNEVGPIQALRILKQVEREV